MCLLLVRFHSSYSPSFGLSEAKWLSRRAVMGLTKMFPWPLLNVNRNGWNINGAVRKRQGLVFCLRVCEIRELDTLWMIMRSSSPIQRSLNFGIWICSYLTGTVHAGCQHGNPDASLGEQITPWQRHMTVYSISWPTLGVSRSLQIGGEYKIWKRHCTTYWCGALILPQRPLVLHNRIVPINCYTHFPV